VSAGKATGDCSKSAQVKNLRDVPRSSDFQGMKHLIVPEAVLIYLSDRGILSVKTGRCRLALDDANLRGQVGIHGRDPFGRTKFVLRYIDMSYLAESMNTGIGPPGTVYFYRFR
jgi:hypothetical protein